MKLNNSKLNLCQTSIKFFGYVLTTEGLKADDTKINAIKKLSDTNEPKRASPFHWYGELPEPFY